MVNDMGIKQTGNKRGFMIYYSDVFLSYESVGPGAPIRQGQSTSTAINRKPNIDLGLYFVGGNETPLVSTWTMFTTL